MSYEDIVYPNGDFERITSFADGVRFGEVWNGSRTNTWNKLDIVWHYSKDGSGNDVGEGQVDHTKEVFANGSYRTIAYAPTGTHGVVSANGQALWYTKAEQNYDSNGACLKTIYSDQYGPFQIKLSNDASASQFIFAGGQAFKTEAWLASKYSAINSDAQGRFTYGGPDQIGGWYQPNTAGFSNYQPSTGTGGVPTGLGFSYRFGGGTGLFFNISGGGSSL